MTGISAVRSERLRPSELTRIGAHQRKAGQTLNSSVRGRDLHADYLRWCEVGKRAALSHKEFFDQFERICADELSGSIRRNGNRYVGLLLADAVTALPAQRVG